MTTHRSSGTSAAPARPPGALSSLAVSIAAHAVAGLPVQALGRRLGLPYTAPRSAEAVLAGMLASVLSAMVAVLASAVGVAAAGRAAEGGRAAAAGRVTPGLATPSLVPLVRPLRTAALGALPVLGPILTAVAEVRAAGRLAAAGHGGDGWRTLSRFLAAVACLAGVRLLTQLGLRMALQTGTPPVPTPPAPLTQLNVQPATGTAARPDGYVVYFDGVGRIVTRTTPAGRRFAAAVGHRLPRWAIVMSLMPNDVTQRPAWRRPATGRVWRRLMRRDPAWLIGRGVWEAVVALDPRYRDRIAADNTTTVLAHLAAAGYRSGSGTPLVFVGLSAGAQTALRCASDVARALGAPLDVVCLGGFCEGAVDLSAVRRVHAAVSWGDPAEMAPVLFFPSRWTAFGVGAWSRARRGRVVVVHRHDWATHVGGTGYLSEAMTSDGRSRLDQAADLVARAARELGEHSRRGGRRGRVSTGAA